MPAPRPYHQLALPVLPTAGEEYPRAGVLSSVQAALAAADRAALAAQLAGVARSRGRIPVPKPGPDRPSRPARRIAVRPVDVGAVAAFRAHVRLTSVDPEANRFRSYALSWRPTLWGDFALVQTWGRLGSPSRSRTTFFPTRPMAQETIVRLLRRRLRHGYEVAAWE